MEQSNHIEIDFYKSYVYISSWTDGRVVEGTGLENRHTGSLVSRVRIPLCPPVKNIFIETTILE